MCGLDSIGKATGHMSGDLLGYDYANESPNGIFGLFGGPSNRLQRDGLGKGSVLNGKNPFRGRQAV
jgi:hypothetical protein